MAENAVTDESTAVAEMHWEVGGDFVAKEWIGESQGVGVNVEND